MPAISKKKLLGFRSTKNLATFKMLIKHFPHRPVIVSEGDSWFDYPPKNLIIGSNSNIIDYIEKKRKFNFLRMENSGDEAVSMVSGKKGKKLAKVLKDFPVDILLFSGGGNDIVGEYDMDLFLRQKEPGMSWKDCIHHPRFQRRLSQIENAYRLLIDMRDEYNSNQKCLIITHTYDYPIPSFHGAKFLGGIIKTKSWMKPYMVLKGITKVDDQKKIAKYFLSEFAKRIKQVSKNNPGKLVVVDTFGTLNEDEWLNEIHATSKGYEKVADKIYSVMEKYL